MGIVAERKALRAEIRERKREIIPRLLHAVKAGKVHQKKRLKGCERDARARLVKVRRDATRARKKLEQHIKRAKERAKAAAVTCAVSSRADLDQVDRALAAVDKERGAIRELRRQAAAMVSERGRKGGKRAAEKRAESDDEVIFNLTDDAHMIELFKKVRRKIKRTDKRSRTEAFLEYVHDHPEELDELRATKERQYAAEAEKLYRERKPPECENVLTRCQAELAHLKRATELLESEAPF